MKASRAGSMRPIPIAEVFHDPETGYFGYRYFYEGRRPHYVLAAYPTLPATLAAFDPHGERVWEESSDADENKILISRSYKPDSVLDLRREHHLMSQAADVTPVLIIFIEWVQI